MPLSKPHLCLTLLATLATCMSGTAYAIDKIDSPNVNEGELDLEYSGYRTFDAQAAKNNLQDSEALVAYAPTDRWEIDLGGFFSRDSGQSFKADGVLFENFFQFAEKGANWMDSGIMIACNCSMRSGLATSLESKLMLEKDIGDFSTIVNVGLDQGLGASGSNGPDYSFEVSSSYSFQENLAVGLEIQSDLGQANSALRWRDQQNYIGPAVYGDLLDTFHYELAYLAGVTPASSTSAVRFLFQYKTHF